MLIILLISILIIIVLSAYIYFNLSCGLCKCSAHLVNKVVIVTGANSGIGFEIAKSMAERGARVILACRNEQRAMDAVHEIKRITRNIDVHYRHLNLTSFKSIRKFAQDIINTEKHLHILVNNAGIIKGANEKTEDGLSAMMQTNYFGPFLLTILLLPLLKLSTPSRIINISSVTHRFTNNIDPDNLKAIPEENGVFTNNVNYFKTKLCITLMTFELARRLKGTYVTANCLHPGAVKTNMIHNIEFKFIKYIIYVSSIFFKTPWEGAQSAIYLAVSPEVENLNGGYYVDCKLANPSLISQSIELAQKLWEISERLVKL